MILTINLDPVEALPKLYDAVDGITRMIMDAKDNVDNPETKAARETIVANAMKLLGAEPSETAEGKKKLTQREFALAALDFIKPLMKLDPQRTMNALHQLYTPNGVRVFFSTLAIADDLISIAAIAIFYGQSPNPFWLGAAVGNTIAQKR